ncbi:SDR family NAD(P)-dependent oxidoreductase [Burkholderia pseudomultivorans]|uniref:Dihydroanticapsin 7-dehydrogenase n=1 Tax=Burkholderia pseudomultivorans TaxID=1207504 RepID=A0A132EIL4_9BURK|nr:SDR family oxidoreductase [Burkholderia pseudomultivorans]KWF30505.1 hypothetical protein WT56_13840 [Burkholderia pseudomultivorans]MDR8728116.1 Dihydroanticapsin 7-dehydrogenase [Burkholderia pseudomultivorans]MDR8737140.1 Dihydroanticapsin 7-dehydrogenase [Burkholderia pseudomultivorans]MDR8740305.1 Dihydroanticapsin 7-dehydrogenase [Burkholderia pseudomultivorans]MDR8754611.1 Dihydroanticapsin 7-dehydrogenase [Burkholderia pseudomultivorans]
MNPFESLDGRVVIVTGGGDGIGLGIVEVLAQCGVKVVVAERNGARAEAVRERLGGREALFVETDVADPASVAALFEHVDAHHGRLDGLVNNAGVTLHGPFDAFSLEDCDRLYRTNLRSMFHCAQLAAPRIARAGGGAIVNIASNHAGASVPGFEMYAATKGGIVAMSRAMATSLAPQRIRVNTLSPGFTMNAPIGAALERDPALLDAYRALHPAQRINAPADIGQLAAFLLSDAAIGVVGADLVADNGMSALLFNRNRSST